MAPISFARGAPAPSCLDPELISDCARAVLERDGTTILSYGTGGGYGPLRELLAERHAVEPGRVFVTTGGLQGFVFYSAALHALEGGQRVTFTSSFSKTVAPGLRVGWFVVPEGLRSAFDDRAVSTYISPPLLPEAIVHELFSRGAFEANLERVRGILRAQRDAMLTALDGRLTGRATWSRPEGGYFLWVDFADGVDAGELLGRATEAGVTFVRGSDFFPGEGGESSARLAFSYETPERIVKGVSILAGLL